MAFLARSKAHPQSRVGLVRASLAAALSAAAVFLVLSLPAVAASLMASLQIYPALSAREIAGLSSGPPTAIVILSAGRRIYAPEYGGETLDELSLERVRYGASLARKTGLPVLISGGLARPPDPPLAQLGAAVLQGDFGVRAAWLEDRSATTAENALYSSQMLKAKNIRRVVLVTHAWHMARARAAFAAKGMTVIPAPTAFYSPRFHSPETKWLPGIKALLQSGYAIHEIIGGLWYRWRYGF